MLANKPRKHTFFFAIIVLVAIICGKPTSAHHDKNLYLQVVRQPEETVLFESRIERGDFFYIDYTHSSDLTPVHDVFQIDEEDTIVLIEEDYNWYGAGLEFHPEADATISNKGNVTQVVLHRVFPHFLLRVGRVANHSITYKGTKVPLKDLAPGGSLVWIRVVRK